MANKMMIDDLNLYYGQFHALKDISLNIQEKEITAFIGPSGCGKSTLLKSLNRMNDLVEGCKITGQVTLDGTDIYRDLDVNLLRKRVGMVFQKPNPFPMSIYDNVAYGPRTHGIRSKAKLDQIVEEALRGAAIWDELKDRLKKSALGLSGGQQQRLCIARALAVKPEVLLMDEPTSALDPISTIKIEELAQELKKDYTIVMVTHNMQQATRISDKTVFFLCQRTNVQRITSQGGLVDMRIRFDEQLKQLNKEMINMGTMIEESIGDAVKALMKQDVELAQKVMAGDEEIDRTERKIEDLCLRLLLQQQPVARDLRNISAALKMVTDMERIGDHATDISELAIVLSEKTYVKKLDHIEEMARETMVMLIQSLEAYVEKDLDKAQKVIAHDDVIDDFFEEVKQELIELIRNHADEGEQAVDLLMVTKYFERIGDHATNIAEWVIFSITGQIAG